MKICAYCNPKGEEDHFISIEQLSQIFSYKHCTAQYRIKQLSQTFMYTLYHTLCLGLFNLTFNIPILWSLTYALATSLMVAHTLYIATYHNPHALVHISTCTCTFQHALIHSYLLTCALGYSRLCCAYRQHTIP